MGVKHFNGLTPAEAERLALLIEECAEVQQIACKVLRHGYESRNPQEPASRTNRELLATEIGHLECAQRMLRDAFDISEAAIADAVDEKKEHVSRWLHHQERAR